MQSAALLPNKPRAFVALALGPHSQERTCMLIWRAEAVRMDQQPSLGPLITHALSRGTVEWPFRRRRQPRTNSVPLYRMLPDAVGALSEHCRSIVGELSENCRSIVRNIVGAIAGMLPENGRRMPRQMPGPLRLDQGHLEAVCRVPRGPFR